MREINEREVSIPSPLAAHLEASLAPRCDLLRLGDGYETGVWAYLPDGGGGGSPVLYVHGIQSHPGWFAGSAAHLAGCGHAVFQVMRRGSGEDTVGRGDARSARQLLEDVETAASFIVRKTDCSKLHLLGVSWGGKLLTAYALWGHRAIGIASLTLVAPGIAPKVDVSILTRIRVAMSLLVRPRSYFDIPLSDVELFTDNEEMREYLRNDPLRLHRATARFLYASHRLDRAIRRAPAGAITIPTTLLLASRDCIIDNTKTRIVLERLAGDHLRVCTLDAAHTIEFEPDPTEFHHALTTALQRR